MSTPTPVSPPPGWYADPAGSGRHRWWDGRGWTDYFTDEWWRGAIVQPPLPAGARVDTLWIWLLVAAPLLTLMHLGGVLGLLPYALSVLLAALDRRALGRLGVVRPFHWAYAFIPAPVYLIGRTVVLRRRVGRGLAPLLTWLAMIAAVIVLGGLAAVVIAVTHAHPALPRMSS